MARRLDPEEEIDLLEDEDDVDDQHQDYYPGRYQGQQQHQRQQQPQRQQNQGLPDYPDYPEQQRHPLPDYPEYQADYQPELRPTRIPARLPDYQSEHHLQQLPDYPEYSDYQPDYQPEGHDDYPEQGQPQPPPPPLQTQPSWKTPLETVLEEEEEDEEQEEVEEEVREEWEKGGLREEPVVVEVDLDYDDVISTQSSTSPLINERDPRQMNECLKLSFEDVIAEPESVRSGDRIWIWSNALFELARIWFYRIVTVLLAVPVSMVTGMLFGILSCLHIWFLTPCVKITLLNTPWLETLWSSVLDVFVLPLQRSAANCYGQIGVRIARE
ncbi:hydroxysteroid dehydrogenase-like protein 2 [Engraulis encrasicolus]|uniref:hydroxysteroid dehydrogenase-like protein 2 n=1 Tax=Engraulis encrasicolus TaxID=184585 RepID=UPI002FD6B8A3